MKPSQKQPVDTVKLSIDAARKLFLKRGYDGVNLDAIAKSAGLSRQTLYNNFGSKDALFRAMLSDHWMQIRSEAFDSERTQTTPATLEDDLRHFGQRMMGFIDTADQIAFTRLVIAEARRSPWIAQEFYDVGKGPLLQSLVSLLEQWQRSGEIACNDTRLAARQFFGLILECTFWPHVMAIGPAASALPAPEVAIEEAVLTFLARYAT